APLDRSRGALRHLGDVAAGAETAGGAGQYDSPARSVRGRQRLQAGQQTVPHGRGEGVPARRVVQNQNGECSVPLQQYAVVNSAHRITFLAHRAYRRRSGPLLRARPQTATRFQRIRLTSSAIGTNTASTASPIRIVAGSTASSGSSGPVTRLPTRRMAGSSSSSTTITLYGACSLNTGSSGGCGTTKDQIRPRHDIFFHSTFIDPHAGHMQRGGKRSLPHSAHACIASSPRTPAW